MSIFLLHAPACAPDAGFVDLPRPESPQTTDPYEVENLLHCQESDECDRCARKKRRTFDAYPAQPYPEILTRRFPDKKGYKRFFALVLHFSCCARSRRRYQLITRYRYHKQKKPYSAISVHVEQLTSETYDEDDLAGVPDLLEVVKLQATGSQEVARALRKKLKYGNVHRQLRALTILDGLLQNGGTRVQRALLSDGPLLERLRIAAADPTSDHDVRTKCKDLFGQVLRETEEEVAREQEMEMARTRSDSTQRSGEPSSPTTLRKHPSPVALGESSTFAPKKVKKDKKSKQAKGGFNLEREKPNILQSIAASSVASTGLTNALRLVNRESQRVSDNAEVMKRFETCKQLRRQILRYIQFVETEEFLGGLIHANEELVNALMAFEVLDKSVDDDSDSELEEAQHLSRQAAKSEASAARDAEKMVAGLSISAPPKPPRPAPRNIAMPPPRPSSNSKNWRTKQVESDSESETDVEDDPDDPFADKNAMKTPDPDALGRKGYSWKEV
ncbi:GAT domain-containing protein [Cladophialophora immunda]|nr:GAT domain-containing protein [Cladophialophora immunda]